MAFESNRKDTNRMHIAVPVRLVGEGPDGQSFDREAWTLNVSSAGAAIQVPTDLSIPERLHVRCEDYQFRADADVVVVWERRSPQRAIGVMVDPRARRTVWQAR